MTSCAILPYVLSSYGNLDTEIIKTVKYKIEISIVNSLCHKSAKKVIEVFNRFIVGPEHSPHNVTFIIATSQSWVKLAGIVTFNLRLRQFIRAAIIIFLVSWNIDVDILKVFML